MKNIILALILASLLSSCDDSPNSQDILTKGEVLFSDGIKFGDAFINITNEIENMKIIHGVDSKHLKLNLNICKDAKLSIIQSANFLVSKNKKNSLKEIGHNVFIEKNEENYLFLSQRKLSNRVYESWTELRVEEGDLPCVKEWGKKVFISSWATIGEIKAWPTTNS